MHQRIDDTGLRGRRLGTAALGVALLLSGCASAAGAPTGTTTVTELPTTGGDPAAAPPSPVSARMGATAVTPGSRVTVSGVVDPAARTARPPSQSGTHWATASVKQCATTDTPEARWAMTLADGQQALETQEWPAELTSPLVPDGEPMSAGQCRQGLVYVVVPDGARVTAVVMQGTATSPQVTWPLRRHKARG